MTKKKKKYVLLFKEYKNFLLKKRISYYVQYFNNLTKLFPHISKMKARVHSNNKTNVVNIKNIFMINNIIFKNQFNLNNVYGTRFIKILFTGKFFFLMCNYDDDEVRNLFIIYFNKILCYNNTTTYKNIVNKKLTVAFKKDLSIIKLLIIRSI